MKTRNRHTFCNDFSNMIKRVFAIFAMSVLALACTKEDRNNTIVGQEESIDRYINSLDGVRISRNGGSNRIVYMEGSGKDSLAVGDSVKFYYAGYIFSSGKGNLFATNHPQVAQEHDFPLSGGIEERILDKSNLISGLAYGLEGAKAGEKCDIVFSAKYGFGNSVVYNVPKLTPLIFEVWIESIVKN